MSNVQTLLIFACLTLKKSISLETFLDTDDFQTLLLNNKLYVDKTLFIDDFIRMKASSLLIVRPSGWGKSINMDMLRRFFQTEVDSKGDTLIKEETTNGKLFLGGLFDVNSNQTKYLEPLLITKVNGSTQHMGKHPVIHVKMKNTSGNSYEEIMAKIKTRIKQAFEHHRYLLNSPRVSLADELGKYFEPVEKFQETDLPNCLYFLCWKLFQHFGQSVIVLIDDYDAPIINAYLRFGAKSQEFKKVLEFMKNLYRITLSSNYNLRKSLLSGSLKISLTNDTRGLGSDVLDISTLSHSKFCNFFGITHSEVINLLTLVPSPKAFDLTKMKLWYGGYKYEYNDMFYYNSRSIMRHLWSNGTFEYYGLDSNKSTGLVDKLLTTDNIQPKIHQLMSGVGLNFSVFDYANPIRWERVSILETLFLNGYLCSRKIPFDETNQQNLIIPNKEMNYFYATKVLQWLTDKLSVDFIQFHSLAETLLGADIQGFEKGLQKYFTNATLYIYKLDDEAKVFYVGFMIALQRTLASSHFTLMNDSEGEFSTEEEMLLMPKTNLSDTAVAINYKRVVQQMEFMANVSLEEIRSSQYADKLKKRGYIKKLIKIGAAFCRDKVVVKHEIENITSDSTI